MMDNSTENIGAILKEQREKLGYSLQDVAQHTRIRKVYLENIESNQFADLPGKAYVTGFIRVYASHLGLDSNELLSMLESDQPEDTDLPTQTVSAIDKTNNSNSFPTASGWGLFFVSFLVVLAVGALIYLYLAPSTSPPEESDKTVSTSISVGKYVEPGPEVVAEPTGEVAETADEVQPPEVAGQEDVTPVLTPVVTKTSQRKAWPPVLPGGSSLRMLALTESSLIIYVDNRKPQQHNLHDGLDLTWKIKGRVTVELADPGVAHFWLDGRKLGLGKESSFQLQQATSE